MNVYPGTAKIEFCNRLGDDWHKLADFVEIPSSDQRQFENGLQPRGIWQWLEDRQRLGELPNALREISRTDLAELLEQSQQSAAKPIQPAATDSDRSELAIRLQARSDHWQHQFFLPHQPDPLRPELDCPEPQVVFSPEPNGPDGDELFQLLFGRVPDISGDLLAAAFGLNRPADPTFKPLRIRLLTDDDRLSRLAWHALAYAGRPLRQDGWTVEWHATDEPGFPEYPSPICYFPGRVVLLGSKDDQNAPHFQDVQRFFQHGWQDNPAPQRVFDAAALRAALSVGSTRLVYYYGPASEQGLLLDGADQPDSNLSWVELAEWLQQARSVSILYLNIIGDSIGVLVQGRVSLVGVRAAVLMQCQPRPKAHSAAKVALQCLEGIFQKKLDPVVALHRYGLGPIAAWTRYADWQIVAPDRHLTPDLVDGIAGSSSPARYFVGG